MDQCQEKMALHLYWHLRLLLCLHESESCCYRNTSISRSANVSSSSALHRVRLPSPISHCSNGKWQMASSLCCPPPFFLLLFFFFLFFCLVLFRVHGKPRVVHKTTCHGKLRTFCEADTPTEHLIFVWLSAKGRFFLCLPTRLDALFTRLLFPSHFRVKASCMNPSLTLEQGEMQTMNNEITHLPGPCAVLVPIFSLWNLPVLMFSLFHTLLS